MFGRITDDILDSECLVGRLRNRDKFIIKKLYYGNNKPKSNDPMVTCYLEDFVAKPLICKSKELAPMFKIGIPSKKHISIEEDPVELITMLILDYDNETMNQNLLSRFCDKFKKYKFYLYTTFNSNFAYKRFRVILPLKNVIYSAHLDNSNYIDYLVDTFSVDGEKPDRSCFLSSQMQIVPVTNDISLYKYVINKSKKRIKLKSYDEVLEGINKEVKDRINSFKLHKADELVTFKKEVSNVTFGDFKKAKSFFDKIKVTKTSNFSHTDEYKDAEHKLETKGIVKEKVFKTKFDFIKHWIPKAVAKKKISIFYEEWLKYYNFDINDNNKWYTKFKSCLESYLKKKNISEDNLI